MYSFFKKNNHGKIVLILDISSTSIGAAIVKNFTEYNKTPIVLKTERIDYLVKKDSDNISFLKYSLQKIDETLKKLIDKDNDFGKIDQIRVFFGPPWYKSNINNLSANHKHQKYTSKYLKEILKKNPKNTDPQLLQIERDITSYNINGYKTKKALNKKGDALEVFLYESFVFKETIKKIKSVLSNNLACRDIKFFTYPISIYRVLNSHFNYKKTYTVINVTSNISEIYVLRNNNFEEIISIPYGFNTSKKEAGEIEGKIFAKTFSNEWSSLVKNILKKSNIRSLPVDVFLMVNNNYQELMTEVLNNFDTYYNALKFGRKPNINFINSNEISNLSNYKLNVKKDSFISMEAAFLEIVE